MDYLACEMSEHFDKDYFPPRIMSKHIDNKTLVNKNFNQIPKGLFLFKHIQDLNNEDISKARRYELFYIEQYSFSELLILAYTIFEKDLYYEGYAPLEISIELVKKGTECLESSINMMLDKKNFKETFILELAQFVDNLDLEISWFILWTDIHKSNQNNLSRNSRKTVSGKVRQNVFMRDNYTCQICGATVKDGAKLELDHIIPVSKGGTNDEDNLQVLCQQCNREKHNRTDLKHDENKLKELKG